jgi:glycosyltransferase involved in cell wall biosynthesis
MNDIADQVSKPLVSLVIPSLNEQQYMARCLESLLAQDYPIELMEILICDGRSTDRTRDIVAEFTARHPQVKLLDNPRKITPCALNTGIRASRGDAVVRIDAHCEYPTNYVSTCVQVLQESGADNVGGSLITLPGADTTMAKAIVLIQTSRFGLGGARYRLGGGKAGPADTVAFGTFRRSIFDKAGLYDEELLRNQDVELNTRILKAGGRIHYDPRIQLKYYSRPTLGSFVKMLSKNGLYTCLVIQKTPSAFRLRHTVPAIFLLVLVATALGGFLWHKLWLAMSLVLGMYLLCAAGVSLAIAMRHGLRFLFVMPLVFLVSHLAYGAATWQGFFKFIIKGRSGAEGQGHSAGR